MKPRMFGLLVILLCLLVAMLYIVLDRYPTGTYYNCDIAEFHPDIPPAVKEECRRLRRGAAKGITI
jgi:hypothetical protein